MEFIAHRINTIEALSRLDAEYGVELDIRDKIDGSLFIQHDPFEDGDDFEQYLQAFSDEGHRGTMVLNVKSERIEFKVIELMNKYSIKEYFFLDSSFPMIFSLSNNGEKSIALRYSEFEGIDTIMNMKGRVNWIWIDCFTRLPLDKKIETKLRSLGYKLCLVSPELQGRPEDIESFNEKIKSERLSFDAICTKEYNIPKWKKVIFEETR